MCGRFQLSIELDKILERYGILETNIDFLEQKEIFPSNMSPVIINENGEKKLKMFKWGFKVSFTKKLLINARSETVYQKPTFRESFINRRCLVPANLYYEWKKTDGKSIKYKFYTNEGVFSLGGLYKTIIDGEGNKYNAYTILTRSACKEVRDIHNRMPVIINRKNEDAWLDNKNMTAIVNIMKSSYTDIMKEKV